MSDVSSVCVFCGSKPGADPAHAEAARTLGRMMAERGIRLVYGGGRIGLMGIVADAVLAAGGEVIGVIPDFLMKYEVCHQDLTDLIVTDSMHTRKRAMFDRSDAFVTLPGGLGTLDETFEIATWKQLRQHDQPIILMDVNGYWQPFIDLARRTVDGGYAHEAIMDLWTVVKTPAEVFDAIAAAPDTDDVVLTSHF
ncbi:MAG: TIGR00730 family Rossman fold protein [Rhodospirillaceae bacterium]